MRKLPRRSADGNKQGYSIVVFGGRHADVAINEHSAAALARLIAAKSFSCIIDLGEFGTGARRRRFMADFMEEIYSANAEPLHLILDEAHMMAPQKPLGEMQRLTHWTTELVSGGGNLVWTGQVALRRDRMDWPMKWTKPQKIFLPSHGDLFHDDVPDDFIDRVWAVMALTRHHTYQVLTKRSKRQQLYLSVDVAKRQAAILHEAKLIAPEVYEVSDLGGCHWWPLPNVWCGVSVEDRKRLPRLGHLRETPAAVRFVSFEPLLEDLGDVDLTGIDQAICGGESGPGKRATDPAWHRRLLYQCRQQGVAFFEKQIDKVQPIPADLQIREFPKGVA